MPIVNIAVLNYNNGCVDIYNQTTIRECIDDEDESKVIDEFLLMDKGYHPDEISWMVSVNEIQPNFK